MIRGAAVLALMLVGSAAGASGIRVIDGDTIEVAGETYRLIGLDAPETYYAECRAELQAGLAARRRLAELLRAAVTIEARGTDRYGRTLAVVRAGGRDVAKVMIDEGLARPYDGGRRETWCR